MSSAQNVRNALARHREQASIGIDFTWPIYWQMDVDLGKMLTEDLVEAGGSWEVRRATPSLASMIPAKCGLYMFVFRSHVEMAVANGVLHRPLWVLYVGRAGNAASVRTLKDRYKGEYAKYIAGDLEQLWEEAPTPRRPDVLRRYLAVWPLEYWYLVVDDRNKIAHLEDRLIKLFAPPLNRIGQLRLRAGKPKPAFRIPT